MGRPYLTVRIYDGSDRPPQFYDIVGYPLDETAVEVITAAFKKLMLEELGRKK